MGHESTSDFHIIGGPRSGEQTLGAWLDSHPSITLSRNDGFAACTIPKQNLGRCPEAPYNTRVKGILSDWARYTEFSVSAILKNAPEARFIVCLSNPAELAWGAHSRNLRQGIEPVKDFHTAWNLCPARRTGRGVPPGVSAEQLDYTSISALGRQVARLLSQVPRDRILFIYLDDLSNKPHETWVEVCRFLGVAKTTLTDDRVQDNVIKSPALPVHDIMLTLRKWKRRILPNYRTGFTAGLRINGLCTGRSYIKPLPRSVRQSVCDTLSEDIAMLSVLTNRDLSDWLV